MAKHSPRFESLVAAVKNCVREISAPEVKSRLDRGHPVHLVDVREESEWAAGHIPRARHIGKGVIERDIEIKIPDFAAEIVLYCGGGYRSALAADNLQKMGYQNVLSMQGGFRAWREAGFAVE